MSEERSIEPQGLEHLRRRDLWYGTEYELAIQFPTGRLDSHTQLLLLRALWGSAHLSGIVLQRDDYGKPWLPLTDAIVQRESLYGCMLLDNRHIGCRTVILDYQHASWALLSIPMAMLDLVVRVDYENAEKNANWMAKLDATLAHIGSNVYSAVPFEYGLLGEEASAGGPILHLIPEVLASGIPLLVPEFQFRVAGITPVGSNMGGGLRLVGGFQPA